MADGMEMFDVTIVGGGPAGLYAAFYGGLRDMRVKLIEASGELGGRLRSYADKTIWDVGGVPPTRCAQLAEQMIRQARIFGPTIVLGQRIAELERREDGTMTVVAASGERHHTRTLILALGHGVPGPRKLELEGAARYEAANLHYAATVDKERLRGKTVLLSCGGGGGRGGGSGGRAALARIDEWAALAARLIVVRSRDDLPPEGRPWPARSPAAEYRVPYVVERLHGDGERIEAATIARVDAEGVLTGARERLAVDELLVDHGTRSEYGPIVRWGLEQTAWNFDADESLATRLPGVFVAGDAANFPSKLHLIAGAIADAALAVNSAKRYLDPAAPRAAPMSTSSPKLAGRGPLYSASTIPLP